MTYECPKVRELEAEVERLRAEKPAKPVVWMRECERFKGHFQRVHSNGVLRYSEIQSWHSWLAIYADVADVRVWTEPEPVKCPTCGADLPVCEGVGS